MEENCNLGFTFLCFGFLIVRNRPNAELFLGWFYKLGWFYILGRVVLGQRPPFLAMAESKQLGSAHLAYRKGSARYRDPKRKLKRECSGLHDR